MVERERNNKLMCDMAKLNEKQQRFCDEYLIDLNATQAAIRAGYSVRTAKAIGSKLLTKVDVQSYISTKRKNISDRNDNLAQRVIDELSKLAFSNMKDYVNGGNNVLEIKHLDDDKTAAVAGVKTKLGDDGSTWTEIKLHDKVSALEKLGRHLGIFERDNKQQTNNITFKVGFGTDE